MTRSEDGVDFVNSLFAESPHSNNIASGDAVESNMELLQPQNAISEAQDDVQLSRSSGANTKRKRQSKAKGKGKSTTPYIGESSASQQPEPNKKEKSLNELIKKNSIAEVLKALNDRLSRLKDKDEKADMIFFIYLMSKLTANKVVALFAPVVDSIKEIKKQWPARSDVQDIKKMINGIVNEVKAAGIEKMKMKATDEMKPRLLEVGQKIEKAYEQRREDSTKVKNLEPFFTSEGISTETLSKVLSSALPWLVLREIATSGPTADQDQGSLQTREQYTALENELFAEDNNIVDVSDFKGLEEITESTGWNIPDDLEHIASKIKNARGKATEFVHNNIQVLVCAAIKEMEDMPVENLDWGMLKKWGATLNKAKELGFQVKFAEIMLKNNLYAYFGHSKVIGH